METATTLNVHPVPHWERITPIESRVEIAFDLGVDSAKTNVAQLRRDLFATLNDVLPQIAKAAPPGADMHAAGSADSDFDFATVDFRVDKGGEGQWRKEGDGKNTRLAGKVAVTLQTDYPIAAGDALQTVRASVADDIAALIAEGYGNVMNGKSQRPIKQPKAMESRAA